MLTAERCACSMRGYVSRARCGGGLPRSEYFAILGPRLGNFTTPPRILPVLTRSTSGLACVWCVETQVVWDAAVGCLAMRFSPNGPSKTRCHDDTSKIPSFDMLTAERCACSMRDYVSRAGCGGGLPRSEYFAKWALDSAISRRRLEYSLF